MGRGAAGGGAFGRGAVAVAVAVVVGAVGLGVLGWSLCSEDGGGGGVLRWSEFPRRCWRRRWEGRACAAGAGAGVVIAGEARGGVGVERLWREGLGCGADARWAAGGDECGGGGGGGGASLEEDEEEEEGWPSPAVSVSVSDWRSARV